MAITITLTDEDALEYIEMKSGCISGSMCPKESASTVVSQGDPIGTVLTLADIQKQIDDYNREQGIEPAVEITPTAEQASQILADVALGRPSGQPVLQENNTVVGSTAGAVTLDYNSGPTEWKHGVTVVVDGEARVYDYGTSVTADASEVIDTAAIFGGQGGTVALPNAFAPTPSTAETSAVPAPPTTTVQSQAAVGVPPPVVAIPPKLDIRGLPWDQRIHSGSQSINKDGTWRVKKGVDAFQVTAVIDELKALMAAKDPNQPQLPFVAMTAAEAMPTLPAITVPTLPAQPFVPPPPPPAAADTGAALASSGSVPQAPAVITVPVSPQGLVVPPPPATTVTGASPSELPNPNPAIVHTAQPLGFGEMIFKVSQAVAQKRLTDARIKEVCDKFQVPGLPLLSARPDLIPAIAAELGL